MWKSMYLRLAECQIVQVFDKELKYSVTLSLSAAIASSNL